MHDTMVDNIQTASSVERKSQIREQAKRYYDTLSQPGIALPLPLSWKDLLLEAAEELIYENGGAASRNIYNLYETYAKKLQFARGSPTAAPSRLACRALLSVHTSVWDRQRIERLVFASQRSIV